MPRGALSCMIFTSSQFPTYLVLSFIILPTPTCPNIRPFYTSVLFPHSLHPSSRSPLPFSTPSFIQIPCPHTQPLVSLSLSNFTPTAHSRVTAVYHNSPGWSSSPSYTIFSSPTPPTNFPASPFCPCPNPPHPYTQNPAQLTSHSCQSQ